MCPFTVAFSSAGFAVGRFPRKLPMFLKRKRQKPPLAVPSSPLLLRPPRLVSAYLNSLRVRVYFCEIILNQCICIGHFFKPLVQSREPLLTPVRGTRFHWERTEQRPWCSDFPSLGLSPWKGPLSGASEPEGVCRPGFAACICGTHTPASARWSRTHLPLDLIGWWTWVGSRPCRVWGLNKTDSLL